MIKNSNILKNIPKTIILELKNNTIIECYGDKKNLSDLKNKKLQDIFKKRTYDLLKKLLNKKYDTTVITWDNKEYEVHFKNKILYFHDITQYSNVELQLKQSLNDLSSKKEELQAVFDLAANGISILDRNGIFLYANKFFQNMMEYTMEELYKESCISLSAPEYAKPSQTAVQKAIQYGGIEKFKKICITKSGVHLNASMSLSYLESRDEILMITSDITEDIQYQDKLKKQVEIEVAKRSEQHEVMCHQSRLAAMGEMIDSIAHQWKNPLSIINMLSQSINLEYELMDEPDIKHILAQSNKIQETVHHLVETLEEFRSFFRPNIPLQEVTLKEMIDSVHLLMKDQLVINSVQTNIIGDPTLTVKIIPNQFKHVLINLLNNSKDAFNEQNIENKLVEYEISKNGSKILLKIIDNAGGIPENIIDHIFEANFTTKAEGKGTGIGLYMTQQIIDKIGATIKVQNVKDGTCFCIEFDDIKNDEL